MTTCKITFVAPIPGLADQSPAEHQCSAGNQGHTGKCYCGCGYEWDAALSLAQRNGEYETRTPEEWDRDPRNKISVMSWSDFGYFGDREGIANTTRITWEKFREIRSKCTIQVKPGYKFRDLGPND